MKAAHYAHALARATQGKGDHDTEAVLRTFAATLVRNRHERLLPRIAREYEKLEARRFSTGVRVTVATREDAERYADEVRADLARLGTTNAPRVVVDSSVIGGYEARAHGVRLDRTYKRALLDLYARLTSPLSVTNS